MADVVLSAGETRPLRARFVAIGTEHAPFGVTVYEAKDPGAAVDDAIATGGPAPYGAVLWDSAVDVARVLRGQDLRGRRVLELGCGCGLAGIVAALEGAEVLCTDVDPHTLTATARGAADADVGDRLQTALFDLVGAAPFPEVAGGPATDLILADVLYEPGLAAACARRTRDALAAGMRVIVGDPERAGRTAYIKLLAEHGVVVDFQPPQAFPGVASAGAPRAPAPTVAILTPPGSGAG